MRSEDINVDLIDIPSHVMILCSDVIVLVPSSLWENAFFVAKRKSTLRWLCKMNNTFSHPKEQMERNASVMTFTFVMYYAVGSQGNT